MKLVLKLVLRVMVCVVSECVRDLIDIKLYTDAMRDTE